MLIHWWLSLLTAVTLYKWKKVLQKPPLQIFQLLEKIHIHSWKSSLPVNTNILFSAIVYAEILAMTLIDDLANRIHIAKFKCRQYYKWTQLHMLHGTVHQIKIMPKFILHQNAKFSTRQYFRLYGIMMLSTKYSMDKTCMVSWMYPFHFMQRRTFSSLWELLCIGSSACIVYIVTGRRTNTV